LAIAISNKASKPTQQNTSVTEAKAAAKAKAVTPAKAAPAKAAPAKPVPAKSTPAAVVSLGRTPAQPPSYTAAAAKPRAETAKTAAVSRSIKPALAEDPGQNGPPAFVADGGPVVVDIKGSDSGYDNKIYWSADNWQTRNYLGVDNQTATIDLGSFKPGTKIEFGIDNGNGDFFRTGGAAANSDQFQHARVAAADGGGSTIGFEDLRGGGDRDFNDAIIEVRTRPAVSAPQKPDLIDTQPKTPDNPEVGNGANPNQGGVRAPERPGAIDEQPKAPDNRSGLGDGTNPGQGGGRVNSPNTGTDNPNNKPVVAKPKAKAPSHVDVAPVAPVTVPNKPVKSSKLTVASAAIKSVRKA
jgi:hypothetical protein